MCGNMFHATCERQIGKFKNKFFANFPFIRRPKHCVGHSGSVNSFIFFCAILCSSVTDLIRPEEEISALAGDDDDFDEIKRLCDESTIKLVRLRPSDVCNRRLFYNNNSEVQRTNQYPSSPAIEMNAMSVVSLYDQDYAKEMGCDE